MTSRRTSFASRYGPWAIVAGASDGLGAEFARQIAERGLNVVAVARSGDKLEALARRLGSEHGIEVRSVVLDLANDDLVPVIEERTKDMEVGLLVYNAAFAHIAPFLDQPIEKLLRSIDVNCRGPVVLSHHFGRQMLERGRGGIVLMSSMTGLQGSALLAGYAATKAFDLVLAEGLSDELGQGGIDVLGCCAGATRTPNYLATNPLKPGLLPATVMEPSDVVAEALESLGKKPSLVSGRTNRLMDFLMHRLLSRRRAVSIMGKAMRDMYPRKD